MKKLAILLGLAGMTAVVAAAQEPGKAKPRNCSCSFSSINQGGILEGEAGTAALFQTINGIRYKSWFAGIGAGLDYYHVRGVPVFLDIRRDILKRDNTPFIYADGGVHFAWERNKDITYYGRNEFGNSIYYDVGVGYRMALKNRTALLLNIGYSYKEVEQKVFNSLYCIFPPCPENVTKYNYTLNRLSLKMGLQF